MRLKTIAFIVSLCVVILVSTFLLWAKSEYRPLNDTFNVEIKGKYFKFENLILSKKYNNFSISADFIHEGVGDVPVNLSCIKEDFNLKVQGPYGVNPKVSGEFRRVLVHDRENEEIKRVFWPIINPDNIKSIDVMYDLITVKDVTVFAVKYCSVPA